MAGKQFELLFKLTAALGPNFSKSFQSASKTISVLKNDMTGAKKKLSDVSAYQKQQKAVEKNEEKVRELREEHERLEKEIEETGEKTPELTQKLKENEKALEKQEKQLVLSREKLSELSETLRNAGIDTENLAKDTETLQKQYDKLKKSQEKVQEITEKQSKNREVIAKTKGQLTGLIGTTTALAGSFFALDAATEEYRNNQTKLRTAFEASKLSSNAAKQAHEGFYKVLGDDDTAIEASQLLAKLAKNEADVSKWTNISAGVYATFGDALPIEGLIESSNETARTGQVAGVLADAINWASKEGEKFGVTLKANTKANEEWNKAVQSAETAEDYFNLALKNCSSEAERNQLIMNTLQDTYQDATKIFKENNKQIIQNRQAQLAWNDILGKTGQIASTVKGMMLEMFGITQEGTVRANSALEKVQTTMGKLADNPELVKTIAKIATLLVGVKAGGLTAKLGFLYVKDSILSVQKAFTVMKGLGIAKYLSSITSGFSFKSIGSGIFGYFKNIKTAIGGVSTAFGNIFVGNKLTTMLGPLGQLIATTFGPLGGIVGKILPIVGVVTTVITVFKLLKNHLQDIRMFIERTFGNEALVMFDKLIAIVSGVGTAIKTIFSEKNIGQARNKIREIFGDKGTKVFDTFVRVLGSVGTAIANVIQFVNSNLVPVAEQVLQLITQNVIPGIMSFMQSMAPIVIQIIQSIIGFIQQGVSLIANFIVGLMPVVSGIITFVQNSVLPVISQVFSFITSTVMPVISQSIQDILPVIMNVLSVLLPMIQTSLTTIWNIVMPVVQGISTVVQAVMPIVLSNVQSVVQTIGGIIQNLVTLLSGIIEFVQGVFTANWTQAWEGIKSIFSGAVGGLDGIIKAPLRAVVSAVNTVIGGLNKLKVPDWVPGLGGKGINIPLIPGFAKGTNRTPSTFIAGENGPELITNAPNRKVFTAAQTGQIFHHMAEAENLGVANKVNVPLSGASTITIHVSNSPTIVIQKDGDVENLKTQLTQYDEEFLEKIRMMITSVLREQKEQEGRVAYV